MTERIYYDDPYCREFDATIEAVGQRDGRAIVQLNRTAFYPTSGGQPFDTGVLDSVRVVDVVENEDGTLQHVVEGEQRFAQGQTVHGAVDWTRRFDHMQQHTGQHVLSAAIERRFGTKTISFHLGALSSTIDLARERSAEEIAVAESDANRIVWEDRPIRIRYASPEEAAALPLRKEPQRGGVLRLIDIEQHDLSACGGTHVASTGAVGMIAVGSWERFKGGQRLEFSCGGRALARFGELRAAVAATVRQLSVLPHEIAAAVERLKTDARDSQRTISTLLAEVARYRAAEFLASAEPEGGAQLVMRAIDGDVALLKLLAGAIAAQPASAAVLVSSGRPVTVVIARAADLGTFDANRLVAALIATFGGRGGGRPESAQAGGLDADPQAILRAAREALAARSA